MHELLPTLVEFNTWDTNWANWMLTTVVDVTTECGTILIILVSFIINYRPISGKLLLRRRPMRRGHSKASTTRHANLENWL